MKWTRFSREMDLAGVVDVIGRNNKRPTFCGGMCGVYGGGLWVHREGSDLDRPVGLCDELIILELGRDEIPDKVRATCGEYRNSFEVLLGADLGPRSSRQSELRWNAED